MLINDVWEGMMLSASLTLANDALYYSSRSTFVGIFCGIIFVSK